jgi:uncharacterized protein YhhL (DUF1145 family)
MSIVGLLVVLVVIGVALYLVNTYVPMAAPIKTIVNVVVVLLVVIWLLNAFGLLDAGYGGRGFRFRN